MSPKLVVIVAVSVPSEGASASGTSTSRAGSWPSSGYSQVVVAPEASGDSSVDSLDVSDAEGSDAVSFPSASLPHAERARTDRQAATVASRFSMRLIVTSAPSHLLVGVRVAAEEAA